MRRPTPALRIRTWIVGLISLPLFSLPLYAGGEASIATATTPATIELTPFKAYYQAQFDIGVSVGGEAVRELKQLEDGSWQVSMRAKTLMASIEETSRFRLDGTTLRPDQYHYRRKVFGKTKAVDIDFQWGQGSIQSMINGVRKTLPITGETYDKVSYQLKLWPDIKAGQQEVIYTLAEKDYLRDYEFDRIGEETIDTPAGRFDTIKVARDRGEDSKRKTYIWFAKAQDHVIVKLEQIETDGKQYVLLLDRIE